jgi:signal peptidase II
MTIRDARLWSVGAATVLADQVSKQMIVGHLRVNEHFTLIPGALQLRHVRNPLGLLHGLTHLGQGYRPLVLVLIPLIILCGLVFAVRRFGNIEGRFATALSLLVGGALGNLIDRLLRFSVVDFIQIGAGRPPLLVFNLADVAMLAGLALGLHAISAGRATCLGCSKPQKTGSVKLG